MYLVETLRHTVPLQCEIRIGFWYWIQMRVRFESKPSCFPVFIFNVNNCCLCACVCPVLSFRSHFVRQTAELLVWSQHLSVEFVCCCHQQQQKVTSSTHSFFSFTAAVAGCWCSFVVVVVKYVVDFSLLLPILPARYVWPSTNLHIPHLICPGCFVSLTVWTVLVWYRSERAGARPRSRMQLFILRVNGFCLDVFFFFFFFCVRFAFQCISGSLCWPRSVFVPMLNNNKKSTKQSKWKYRWDEMD